MVANMLFWGGEDSSTSLASTVNGGTDEAALNFFPITTTTVPASSQCNDDGGGAAATSDGETNQDHCTQQIDHNKGSLTVDGGGNLNVDSGNNVALPDFVLLQNEIRRISPLSRQLFDDFGEEKDPEKEEDNEGQEEKDDLAVERIRDPAAIITDKTTTEDDDVLSEGSWTEIESNPNATIHRITKIDNYRNTGIPLLRFQSRLRLPSSTTTAHNPYEYLADCFADWIMEKEFRSQWDDQVEHIEQVVSLKDDLHRVNACIANSTIATTSHRHSSATAKSSKGSPSFGTCTRLGIGYYRSKPNVVVSAREQLGLCGIQKKFDNNNNNNNNHHQTHPGCTTTPGALIWAIEMPHSYNGLLPQTYERCVRGKSHIFSVALIPSATTGGDNNRNNDNNSECYVDVEYVIQLDCGGLIPQQLTTPMLIASIKRLFEFAQRQTETMMMLPPPASSPAPVITTVPPVMEEEEETDETFKDVEEEEEEQQQQQQQQQQVVVDAQEGGDAKACKSGSSCGSEYFSVYEDEEDWFDDNNEDNNVDEKSIITQCPCFPLVPSFCPVAL